MKTIKSRVDRFEKRFEEDMVYDMKEWLFEEFNEFEKEVRADEYVEIFSKGMDPDIKEKLDQAVQKIKELG